MKLTLIVAPAVIKFLPTIHENETGYKFSGCKPVCFAMRESIFGPISTES